MSTSSATESLVFGRTAVGRATVGLLRMNVADRVGLANGNFLRFRTPKISSVRSSGLSFWRCTVASNPRELQHDSNISFILSSVSVPVAVIFTRFIVGHKRGWTKPLRGIRQDYLWSLTSFRLHRKLY